MELIPVNKKNGTDCCIHTVTVAVIHAIGFSSAPFNPSVPFCIKVQSKEGLWRTGAAQLSKNNNSEMIQVLLTKRGKIIVEQDISIRARCSFEMRGLEKNITYN